jgi:acetyl esterase
MLASAVPPDISLADFRALEPAHAASLRPFSQPVADIIDRTIPGPAGEIPIRVYAPFAARPHPLVVLLQGGGWIVGRSKPTT